MKVKMNKINESRLSIEYISSMIEDCDANGLMAIADDAGGEIYIFDPKSNLYATSTDLMESDATIDDIIHDEELKNEVMLPAIGDKFKEFAVKWNDLEKKGEDEEVYKTKKCAPIHGNFTESEIENDVVEGIPNWAAYYIGYGEVTDDMTVEDVKLVDDYLRKLDNDGIRLIAPIEGTENEFNPHPAFGDACDTTDWSCEID